MNKNATYKAESEDKMLIITDAEQLSGCLEPLIQQIAEKIFTQNKQNTNVLDRILTRSEFMREYNISATSLHFRIKEGLPHFRIGRRIFFRESEVQKYWDKN